jgi:predicted DNA-binding protein (UPF0251 family)
MSRPPRHRTVDGGLAGGLYGPRGRPLPGVESLELTLDGLEALRLVDLEGLYQEAAAERMGVSRATLARVLTQARRAVAEALVQRKVLVVAGGTIRRRDDDTWPCPVHGQRQRRGRGCRCEGGGRRGSWGRRGARPSDGPGSRT